MIGNLLFLTDILLTVQALFFFVYELFNLYYDDFYSASVLFLYETASCMIVFAIDRMSLFNLGLESTGREN